MSNPWTKKNPSMSMWLSSANKAMGETRGRVTSAAKRQIAATQTEALQQIVACWSTAASKPTSNDGSPCVRRRTDNALESS